jgi:GntR family transcriptional regulator
MAEPLYKQIALDLQQRIQNDELAPGEQLPKEEALREEYGASRNTIRDAIKWLTSRGLVESKTGKGTYVLRGHQPFVTTLSEDRDPEASMAGGEGQAAFSEIVDRQLQMIAVEREEAALPPLTTEEQKRIRAAMDNLDPEELTAPLTDEDKREILDSLPWGKPEAMVPTVEVKVAPGWVAERLRIGPDEEVVVRHQPFHIGSIPWSLQTTFYPMDLVERRDATRLLRPHDIKEGTVKYLQTRGLVQCGSRLRILVRVPNEEEARFFGMPDDGRIPVVSLIRTGYEDRPGDGPYPFRVTFTILPADRNQFVVNRGKVPEELAAPARDQ